MAVSKPNKPLLLSTCLAMAILAGCSKSSKVEVHKPNPLPKLSQSQALTPVFKASIAGGEKLDPLRLQLDATDEAIYAVSRKGEVVAYGLNGKKIWQSKAHKKEKNLTSGVSVADGTVVVGSREGVLYGLDASNGNLRWQRPLSGSILAPSLIHQGRVITYSNDGTVYGTDVATGEPVWTFNTASSQLSVRGTAAPVLADDGTVIIASSTGYIYGLDGVNGIPKWQRRVAVSEGRSEVQRLIDIDGDPIIQDNTLYTVSYQGQITAVDLSSQRVLWAQDTSSLRSPAVGNGLVYVATTEGKLQAFNQQTGEKAWEQEALSYRQLSNPVLLGQYVVVGDLDGYLHLLDPTSGNILGRVRSKGEVRTIRVMGNRLYVATRTGNLSVWQAS
ncbi:outer membrane protein assembly factor BamB [Alkanindiges sp. WGS2144]|uniref:outer membrane protein assembly factor BamB n=1 Tax=Alkanindiges sp. WGS2144 TaxID=3366808 RepID=UPI0037530578